MKYERDLLDKKRLSLKNKTRQFSLFNHFKILNKILNHES